MPDIEEVIKDLPAQLSASEKIDTLNARAWELRYEDISQAIELSEAARELARQGEFAGQPYQKGLIESLRNLGHCHERLNNYQLALDILSEALALAEAAANLPEQATLLYLSGGVYWSLGDYFNALDYELRAIKLCQRLGHKLGLGKALNIIGLVHQSIGDPAQALIYFQQSLQTYEQIGFKRGQGDTLSNSSEVCFELGDYDQALAYGLRSLQIHEEIDYQWDIGIVLVAVGRIYLALERRAEALDALQQALAVARTAGNRYAELRALLYLGEAYARQQEGQDSLSLLQQAQVIAGELRSQEGRYECFRLLADVYKQLGDFEKALTAYEQFFTLKENVLNEIARHKLKILEVTRQAELAEREAKAQHLKNIELEAEIAQRERLEQALVESENRLRHIFTAISDHIYVTDLNEDGQPTNRFVSPTEALTGYSLRQILADWNFWPSVLIHPEDRAKAKAQFQHLISGESSEVEYRLIRANGQVIWVRDSGRVERDPENRKLTIYGIVSDITARKQAEEALARRTTELEETSNLLNGVLENLPAMLFMKDAESLRFTHFNKAAEELVGYSRNDLMGKNDYDFFPKEQADFFVHKDREVLARGELIDIAEEPIQTVQHGQRLLYTRKAPLMDVNGQPKYLLGVSIDITERRRAEEDLLLQQKRLRSLYQITTQPEQEIDQQFKVVLDVGANLLDLDMGIISQIDGKTYTVRYCYAPSAPLQQGQTFKLGQTYCDLTFKADRIICINHAGQSQYKGHPCYETMQIESYIGVPLWVNGQKYGTLNFSSTSPRKTLFSDADRDFVQLIGKWVSTTLERKQAEMALAQARDHALEASRLKSELLARVSHELRNPLGAILGYSELLQTGVFGPLSDQQVKATAEIIDSTYYLNHMVNELLDQAQFETGKTRLSVSPFILDELVKQVEAQMMVLAETKNLTLAIDIAVDLPLNLLGDQKRLQQIMVNLIGNAIKFTRQGKVEVRLYKPDPTHWAVQVADTGIGIPPETQRYIFEPFRQADGSITREYGGTGLGLAIVKQLTTLMKGEVTLQSEVGQGSIFTVILPLNPVEETV